jgi:hypothetical protein
MKCKICSSYSELFANARVLGKYSIEYFQCHNCGFIQTEEPFWLDESYSRVINNFDIGIVSRNMSNAAVSKALISTFFNSNAKFIDYGGGYGIFVRLMRDYGFNFYLYDKFCQNLFAKGFDIEESNHMHFELLTAFELFEHFLDPLGELLKLLNISPNILISTELIPSFKPKPGQWWYYGLQHGQHIAFYTLSSLKYMATRSKINFFSNNRNLHLFTSKKINQSLFKLLCTYEIANILNIFFRRTSLLATDYEALTGTHLM